MTFKHKKLTTFGIDFTMLNDLKSEANFLQISMADLLRKIIKNYLKTIQD